MRSSGFPGREAAASGDESYSRAADFALAVGLAGAVGSAVTGLTDWSETDGRAKRIGLIHGLLNVAATAMMATAYVLRRRNERRAGEAATLAGFAFASVSGYLGGDLVFGEFRHGRLVAGQDRLVGLLLLPLGVTRGERGDAVEGKEALTVVRLLDPERAVVVERGDAVSRRHELVAALLRHRSDEVEDCLLVGAIAPGGKGIVSHRCIPLW